MIFRQSELVVVFVCKYFTSITVVLAQSLITYLIKIQVDLIDVLLHPHLTLHHVVLIIGWSNSPNSFFSLGLNVGVQSSN
jgi:hypothetical protein